jgi:hypothetical protein
MEARIVRCAVYQLYKSTITTHEDEASGILRVFSRSFTGLRCVRAFSIFRDGVKSGQHRQKMS